METYINKTIYLVLQPEEALIPTVYTFTFSGNARATNEQGFFTNCKTYTLAVSSLVTTVTPYVQCIPNKTCLMPSHA